MHYFSQSSIFCVHPSAAAGLRQDFVNDKNGEILLCVTLPVRSFAERPRGWVLYSRSTWRCSLATLVAAHRQRLWPSSQVCNRRLLPKSFGKSKNSKVQHKHVHKVKRPGKRVSMLIISSEMFNL